MLWHESNHDHDDKVVIDGIEILTGDAIPILKGDRENLAPDIMMITA